MIEMFSLRTAHQFQDALSSQARLRHEVFIRQRRLDHSSFDELEFDEFDTPAAIYLVWRDSERIVRGVARLLRTTRPYMLQTYWPYLVEDRELPASPSIFEGTRVCVDKAVAPVHRQRIFPELLCAIQELFIHEGIEGMVGVTRQHLLEHFIRSGIDWMGPPHEVEGEQERAFFVPTAAIRPEYHCRKYGIPKRVILELPEHAEKQSA